MNFDHPAQTYQKQPSTKQDTHLCEINDPSKVFSRKFIIPCNVCRTLPTNERTVVAHPWRSWVMTLRTHFTVQASSFRICCGTEYGLWSGMNRRFIIAVPDVQLGRGSYKCNFLPPSSSLKYSHGSPDGKHRDPRRPTWSRIAVSCNNVTNMQCSAAWCC